MNTVILIFGAIGAGAGAILGILIGWPGDLVPQYVLLAFTCAAVGATAIAGFLGSKAAVNAAVLGVDLQRSQVRSSVLESSASPVVIERADAAAEAVGAPPTPPLG